MAGTALPRSGALAGPASDCSVQAGRPDHREDYGIGRDATSERNQLLGHTSWLQGPSSGSTPRRVSASSSPIAAARTYLSISAPSSAPSECPQRRTEDQLRRSGGSRENGGGQPQDLRN